VTTYEACAIVEGFDGQDHPWQDELLAWAALIESGACWNLQGWYGRNAQALIDLQVISESGQVDWNQAAELVEELPS
jgi:hypothetical protein